MFDCRAVAAHVRLYLTILSLCYVRLRKQGADDLANVRVEDPDSRGTSPEHRQPAGSCHQGHQER